MIKIPILNPIRFQKTATPIFGKSCYNQKFEVNDFTHLQIQSDENEVFYEVINADTLKIVDTVQFSPIPTLLVNFEYTIFEAGIFWSSYDEGNYIIKIGYYQSSVIELREKHKNTQLYTYKNSENNFGIVFDTGIVFRTRVESRIENFSPKFDNEIYNDERRNATKLYSLPFRNFTLYTGSPKGIAEYMLDLMNMVMSCDMIKIDDEWYELTEDAEWEYYRAENYDDFAMSIEIMPSDNRMMEKLIIDKVIDEDENMIIQRYSNNYTDVEEDFNIADTFVKNIVLNYITVFRKSSAFTLKIGTTLGGSEIAEVEISQILQTINLNHYFTGATTLYLSGFTGATDIALVWDRFDKFLSPQSGGDDTPVASLGKGACIYWYGSPEELSENWNVVTGLGKSGTPWQGWAINNGQNGTVDDRGRVTVAYTDDATGVLGSVGGADSKQITVFHLPPHRHHLFSNSTVSSSTSSNLTANSIVAKGTTTSGKRDEKYAMREAGVVGSETFATVGVSDSAGLGGLFDVRQKYIIRLSIMKIA